MLVELTDEEFNQFSSDNGGTFFQTSYWGNLKEFTGWSKELVGIKENNIIVAATLLLSKKVPVLSKKIYYAPRGFLIDYNDFELVKKFTEEIASFVKKNKGIFFKINPYTIYKNRGLNGNDTNVSNEEAINNLLKLGFRHNGFTIDYGDMEPRFVSVLDIKDKSEEEIFNSFRSSHKRKIRKSESGYLTLIEATDISKIEEYKKILEHTGERRGFVDRSLSYYKKMYDEFCKSDNIKIMLIKLDLNKYRDNLELELKEINSRLKTLSSKKENEKIELEKKKNSIIKNIEESNSIHDKEIYITAGLFMTFGSQVIYLFGGSYKEYMSYQGAYFMQWEMIKYAINNGYEKYNFYGITGEFNEDSPMFGLFDFKRGFNADVIELIGEFDYIISKPSFVFYKFMLKVYGLLKKWRLK